jgi:hypothetical protein
MPKPPARTTGKKTTIPPKPNAAQQIAKLDQFVSGKISDPAPKPSIPAATPPTVSENTTDSVEKAKMKRLTLDISEDLHKAIKMQSVTLGIPMVDMLRKLLESHYGSS